MPLHLISASCHAQTCPAHIYPHPQHQNKQKEPETCVSQLAGVSQPPRPHPAAPEAGTRLRLPGGGHDAWHVCVGGCCAGPPRCDLAPPHPDLQSPETQESGGGGLESLLRAEWERAE
ncbi:UNVERIFIED_CONTAM: hypothetical protein K2H54_047298, partial [Gekko kuhli]